MFICYCNRPFHNCAKQQQKELLYSGFSYSNGILYFKALWINLYKQPIDGRLSGNVLE
jgi:hypothetical protein